MKSTKYKTAKYSFVFSYTISKNGHICWYLYQHFDVLKGATIKEKNKSSHYENRFFKNVIKLRNRQNKTLSICQPFKIITSKSEKDVGLKCLKKQEHMNLQKR